MSIKFVDHGGFDVSQCVHCTHLRRGRICAAFPDGIPRAILENEHDHRTPYPGDNGILFSSKRGEPVKESWFKTFRKSASPA